MDLFLLRHGVAVEKEQWTGGDAQRPLSREGTGRMEAEARTMARLGMGLDRILCSPFVRARQTAQIVARALDLREPPAPDERLSPGFDSGSLESILGENEGAKALMLVGHEPDFSRLIGGLTGGRVEFKSGSLARVALPRPGLRVCTLLWLLPPGVMETGIRAESP
jgi:phosphohistidine phosphatase